MLIFIFCEDINLNFYLLLVNSIPHLKNSLIQFAFDNQNSPFHEKLLAGNGSSGEPGEMAQMDRPMSTNELQWADEDDAFGN